MNFGRRRGKAEPERPADEKLPPEADQETAPEAEDPDLIEVDQQVDEQEADEQDDAGEFDDLEPEADDADEDLRADGPFDFDEVDLGVDDVTRVDLGTLIVTPWPGLNLQLQVNEGTRQVQALTGVWQKSGLEVALFAAPASGGLARELRDDIIEEAQQAGGTAEVAQGPFGAEIRRVLPQQGPKHEQLYHVSRIWFAEGPRWLLRGTLLGEAALGQDETKAAPFLEFFRNLVVRRGDKPMVPGEQMTMELPRTKEA